MMRYVRVAVRVAAVWLVAFLCAGVASAQTQKTSRASEFGGYAEVNFGATLGHKSDKSVGGEAGYNVYTNLDVFVEGGHIGNAATSDFDNRGQIIGNAVGASVSAVEKVNYFDVGVRYHLPGTPMVRPYIAFGVGVAQVKNETAFSVNGTTVDPAALGIQNGGDLNGSFNKPFVTVGVGADINFKTRYFADVSYRYGHVSQETSPDGILVAAVPTNRVQVGVGVRF
jgi:opacity protein-like surface antigen